MMPFKLFSTIQKKIVNLNKDAKGYKNSPRDANEYVVNVEKIKRERTFKEAIKVGLTEMFSVRELVTSSWMDICILI